MVMKDNFNKFIFIIILIMSRFLFLIPIDYTQTNMLIATLSILFIIFNSKCLIENKGKFMLHIMFFIFLIVSETIISSLRHNQDLFSVFKTSYAYYAIFLYYIITYYGNEERIEFIKQCFIKLSLIMSIILIAQYFVFNATRQTFICLDLSRAYRMGGVRIGEGSYFITMGMILSLAKLIKGENNNRQKIFLIISLILEVFYIIFVAKTRAFLLVWLMIIVFMIMFGTKMSRSKIKLLFIGTLVLLVVINLPIMDKYKDLKVTEDYSTNARIGAINYYIEENKTKPIFGMGIVYEKNNNDKLSYLLHGNNGIFFRCDVGIFGLYSEFGMLGVIWYLMLIYTLIKLLFLQMYRSNYNSLAEKIGICSYMIFTSATLILVSQDFISYIPFILMLNEKQGEHSVLENIKFNEMKTVR